MAKFRNILKNIPMWCRVLFTTFFVSVILHVWFSLSESFAEFYCRNIGNFFRTALAYITNFFPMSVAEALIIFIPFILASLIMYAVRINEDTSSVIRFISALVSVITLVYSLFVLTFAAGFYVKDIGKYFGIDRCDITVDELYEAALTVTDGVNETYSEIDGKGISSTTMGMDYSEMNSCLLSGFNSLYREYEYPSKLTGCVKPIVLSEPMTYTHISGIYTFFTGEANINVNFPDFVIPYTAAHELSHQRGVSREDEANFVAFLVCIKSDDPYIRYSGYLNMFQYMSSAIANVSYDRYKALYSRLDDGVKRELAAYSNFFDKYRNNIVADVSDSVNDSYLTVMDGTDSRSYGMVVDLAALYLLAE